MGWAGGRGCAGGCCALTWSCDRVIPVAVVPVASEGKDQHWHASVPPLLPDDDERLEYPANPKFYETSKEARNHEKSGTDPLYVHPYGRNGRMQNWLCKRSKACQYRLCLHKRAWSRTDPAKEDETTERWEVHRGSNLEHTCKRKKLC